MMEHATKFSEPPFKPTGGAYLILRGLFCSSVPSLCLWRVSKQMHKHHHLLSHLFQNFPSFHISLWWRFLPNRADEPAASLLDLFQHDSYTKLFFFHESTQADVKWCRNICRANFPPPLPTLFDLQTFYFTLWASSVFLLHPWLPLLSFLPLIAVFLFPPNCWSPPTLSSFSFYSPSPLIAH